MRLELRPLSEQVVVITGASSGIGLCTARAAAKQGARVVLAARSGDVLEQVVTHHPRRSGQSKYGIGRTFRVLLDLLSVHFFLRYSARPGHFFGAIGLALGAIGGAILVYLAGVKFLFDESIGTRPLLLVGFFMVIAGLQMISTGVLAELLARVYLSSEGAHPYLRLPDSPLADDGGWKQPSHDVR